MKRGAKILTAGLLIAGATGLSQCNGSPDKHAKKDLIETLINEGKDQGKEMGNTANFGVQAKDTTKEKEQVEDNIDIKNGYFVVNIPDLEGTPFFGNRRMIAPSYGNLLGFSQAEDIMANNNINKGKGFEATNWVDTDESITVPLIYPELKDIFPAEWSTLANGAFSEYKNVKTNDLLIVTQCKNGKNALAYYKNGKLTLATYVSIGTSRHKTVSGEYNLNLDQIRRRSHKYQNSAMPYSINITGGFFLHQGWSNGKPQSHGCVRVPGFYQKWLYEHLPKTGSKIILNGLYFPTL